MRRITVISAAVALLGTAGVSAYIMAGCNGLSCGIDASTQTESSAWTQDTADAVAALGRVAPGSEIIKVAAGTPDVLAALSVGRGDVVKKGQVLGYLQGYAEQVARRNELNAQLSEARTRLAAEIALDTARIEVAEVRLRQVNEVTPLQIAEQEAVIAGLEASLDNDKDILESTRLLAQQNFASRRTYENQRALVIRQENELTGARARNTELQKKFELERIEATTQIRQAQAALERAKTDIPIDSLAKQIELADVLARNKTLYAPVDGMILNILTWPGEQVGTSPILIMGDTQKMRVIAEVYETDIGRVKLGDTATSTSRALAKPLTGKVVDIGHMIFKNDVLSTDPAARIDARIVEVRIELDDPSAVSGLSNMTVDVIIRHTAALAAAPHLTRAATR